MHSAHLVSIIASLPHHPGIYKYFDAEGNLIYIGKAKNLKKRVSSYFNKSNHENRKTALLVSKISDIQFTLVDSEIDALLLENSLIKKFQPKFNINLKDDKTYPYLCIKNERFPRVFSTRILERDGSEYFGPYANVVMMYTLTDLIKALYPIRNCNFNLSEANIEAGKFKACMEFQIGNCKAPCIGKQDEADYNLTISQIRHILKGNLSEVNKHLKTHMLAAAEELKFEQAAAFKKKLELLESYQSKSTIVNPMIKDVDVFSISTDDKFAFVSYLKVANGIIIQTRTFEIRKRMDESPEELLQFAIAEVRDKYQSLTKEIIVPFDINLKTDEWIFQVPKVGDKKKLLDLATKNAMYYKKEKLVQYEQLDPSLKTDRILKQMQTDLRLKDLPKHIECFDNSNIQGTNAVSACVVFKDARPSKKDYRHFNVKTVDGPNDFDTMREVVYRRYKRVLDENEALPDLIVIDGGKGQLSSAVDSLKSLGIYGKVPILGIAKRLEELFFPEDELPLYIDKKSETLRIIQQIRDEAHRFGITHHRNRRSKEAVKSELTNIDGVGEATMQKVLTVLKSVKKVKESGLEELTEIVGKQKAELIFRYFHP